MCNPAAAFFYSMDMDMCRFSTIFQTHTFKTVFWPHVARVFYGYGMALVHTKWVSNSRIVKSIHQKSKLATYA